MPASLFNKNTLGFLGATTTFALGWALNSPPPPGDPAKSGQVTSIEKAPPDHLTILSPEPDRAPSTAAAKTTPGLEVQLVEQKAAAPLTSENIERLGNRFRTSLDPVERRLAFATLLRELTLENADEIREQIAHLGPDSSEFRDFHYAWGKIARVDAVLSTASSEKPHMAPALAGWASADPRAALQWFNGLDIARDPSFAPLLVERGFSYDRLRNDLLRGLMRGVANTDINLATSYAYDLAAAGDAQAKAMMQMITNKMIEKNGLDETMNWSASLPEGRMQGAATERVVQRWGRTDLDSALAWAQDLGLDYGGGAALSAAYGLWGAGASGTDPLVASQKINDMPDSLSRDFIINGFISGLRHSDPEGAVIWAQDITNTHIREAAVVRAAETYFDTDPAGYTQWLTTSNLPESTRKKLSRGSLD